MPHDDPHHPHTHSHAPATSAHGHHTTNPLSPAALHAGEGRGRTLYLDAFAGIAGDMFVGALLDLGVPISVVHQALSKLDLHGYSADARGANNHAIAATQFDVVVNSPQPHRHYSDIRSMLEQSTLDEDVKRRALATFRVLAVAEGRVHRVNPDDVHFHEVGAVDAIVDIVGACACLSWLGAEVVCAPLPMGHGFVRAEHGALPVPPPAVVEILCDVPTYDAGVAMELVTPTGAALVKANASRFERWPSMRPVATGFGAGTRVLPDRPNLLRVILADTNQAASTRPQRTHLTRSLAVVESNVDDSTGEILAHTVASLLRAGALDAWSSPIVMKKGRPAATIHALVEAEATEHFARLLMTECPTLGVRAQQVTRFERPRSMVRVMTPYGLITMKVATGDGLPETVKPELEEVLAAADQHGVAPRLVQQAALDQYWRSTARET